MIDTACRIYVGEEKCIWDFSGQARKKKPLGCLTRSWEDNIQKHIGEIGWGVTNLIHLAQDTDRGGGSSCEHGG